MAVPLRAGSPDAHRWIDQALTDLTEVALEDDAARACTLLRDVARCAGPRAKGPLGPILRELSHPRRDWPEKLWLTMLIAIAELSPGLDPDARSAIRRVGASRRCFDAAISLLAPSHADDAALLAESHAARLVGSASPREGAKVLAGLGRLLLRAHFAPHRARILATFADAPPKARAALRAAVGNAIDDEPWNQGIGATVLAEIDALRGP